MAGRGPGEEGRSRERRGKEKGEGQKERKGGRDQPGTCGEREREVSYGRKGKKTEDCEERPFLL